MTTHCPICFEAFEGEITEDGWSDISPGDQLADHLTDDHPSAQSKHLRDGVMMDA